MTTACHRAAPRPRAFALFRSLGRAPLARRGYPRADRTRWPTGRRAALGWPPRRLAVRGGAGRSVGGARRRARDLPTGRSRAPARTSGGSLVPLATRRGPARAVVPLARFGAGGHRAGRVAGPLAPRADRTAPPAPRPPPGPIPRGRRRRRSRSRRRPRPPSWRRGPRSAGRVGRAAGSGRPRRRSRWWARRARPGCGPPPGRWAPPRPGSGSPPARPAAPPGGPVRVEQRQPRLGVA